MISVTPSGSIYLCKTPLINDYKNQLTFSNAAAQLTYFTSTVNFSFDNYTYVKKDNVIKVGKNIDEIINCNYLFYRNTGFTSKYYFCFITNMEYINENCTAITIETDCFQTYQFDISYKRCFVEREHVNDDSVGANLVDENLNFGDMISDWYDVLPEVGAQSSYWLVIAGNYDPTTQDRYAGIGLYGNYPQGSVWHAWEIRRNTPSDINAPSQFIYDCCRDGRESFIQSVFALPLQAFSSTDIDATTHLVNDANILNSDRTYDKTAMREFSDYANVKNNKLYTYPYSFLRITNNAGSYNDYKIEDFIDYDQNDNVTNNLVFNVIGTACEGYSCKIRPKNYKGLLYNEDEALGLGKYPTLSWSGDAYTNWLTQNDVNIGLSLLNGATSGTLNYLTGNIVGAGTSVANTIGNVIGAKYDASLMPNRVQGNANAGDVNFAFNIQRFKIMHMRPKREFLKIIDDYFSSYGYRINEVKIPNITGRTNWNYVKTIDCNFVGNNIPQQNLNIIRTMFDNGVTLWHNPSTIYDYSQSNTIVS